MPNQLYISAAQLVEKAIGALGFSSYVDRGDPVVSDFTKADITSDGVWHALDLSGIVPAGAKVVELSITLNNGAVGTYLMLRKNGNVGTGNILRQWIQTKDINIGMRGFTPLDADRNIEYWASDVVWTSIYITVTGWII